MNVMPIQIKKPEPDLVKKLIEDFVMCHADHLKTAEDTAIAIKAFICGLKICDTAFESIVQLTQSDLKLAEKRLKEFQHNIDWYFNNKV